MFQLRLAPVDASAISLLLPEPQEDADDSRSEIVPRTQAAHVGHGKWSFAHSHLLIFEAIENSLLCVAWQAPHGPRSHWICVQYRQRATGKQGNNALRGAWFSVIVVWEIGSGMSILHFKVPWGKRLTCDSETRSLASLSHLRSW